MVHHAACTMPQGALSPLSRALSQGITSSRPSPVLLPNPFPPQSLPRPFTKLRNLDLAEVAERVVADLQGAAGTAGTAEPAGAAKEEPAEAQQEEEEEEAVVEKPKAKKAGGRKGKK